MTDAFDESLKETLAPKEIEEYKIWSKGYDLGREQGYSAGIIRGRILTMDKMNKLINDFITKESLELKKEMDKASF